MSEREENATTPRPRGYVGLMFDRSFGSLFWGKLLSVTATMMQTIVAAVVVFDATGSASMVALVSIFQFAPQLILTPLAGKWADTYDAFKQLLIGRVLCVIGSAALVVWTVLIPHPEGASDVAPVMVAALIIGIGFVLGGPVMQSLVPRLSRPSELTKAMALNSLPMTVGRVAGPAVGAILVVQFGAVAAFSIAAAGHAVFVLALFVIKFPPSIPRESGTDYSVRAGIRYIRSDRTLLMLLLTVAALGLASEPINTLAPALAETVNGSTELVGALTAVFGVGATLALVLLGPMGHWLSKAVMTSVGIWVMVGGLVLAAVGATQVFVLVAFGLTGLGFMMAFTCASTLVQERCPEELRGRIMAFWMVGFIGSRPIGAALDGVLADVFSVGIAFAVTAVILAVMGVFWRPSRAMDPMPVAPRA